MDIRYAQLSGYGNPTMAAEVRAIATGSEGSGNLFGADSFQRQVLYDLFNLVKNGRYPRLQYLVYHNAIDRSGGAVDYQRRLLWPAKPARRLIRFY
jgi:hypothetical protein